MARRRFVLEMIPPGTWLGLAVLAVAAVNPATRPFVVFIALIVIAYTVYEAARKVAEAQNRAVEAAKVPVATTQVQPEGPSFQEVLRAIPDPVLIVSGYEPNDIAGRWIVFANTAARDIFQIRDDGGLLVSSIRNPEVLECVDETLFGNIERTTAFETTGGARDQYWRAFTSPLPTAKNHQRLCLLVVRDETDMRRMERMRADFLANASHELRTPLASLTGFIETLRGHAKDDVKSRERFLDIMAVQADRMGRLINDLLSLSRIELNEHVPPSGEADLTLAVRDVVDGLTLIARDKGVAIKVNGPKPGLYPITGDRDQILQVVQNLIDNALKYAPRDSEIVVDIKLDQTMVQAMAGTTDKAAKLVLLRPDRDVHDYYAKVTVRDSGPGIRREFLPRLAERFYRVEGQKSGDRLGTGLGLAIVKHIVNRHRGGFVVESLSVQTPDELGVMMGEKVTPLPASAATFTAFSAWFPQKGVYGAHGEGPRLVSSDPIPDVHPESLKSAG
jgi:two-component system phosphate regulon sensor histidine kinase PhoR